MIIFTRIPKALVVFLFLLPVYSGPVWGSSDPSFYIRNLWQDYHKAKNDSIRIEVLGRLAFFYSDYLDDDKTADSISEMGVDLAGRSYKPELLLLAYNNYNESNDPDINYQKSLQYAQKACQLSGAENNPAFEWRSYRNLVNVYLSGYQYDKAQETADRVLAIAGTMDNNIMIAESYLLVGKSLEEKNQKIEAFRAYLNAVYLAEKMENNPLLIKCYSCLSEFYRSNKMSDKAIFYKLKQGDLIRSVSPVDSTALMWTLCDLQGIEVNGNTELNEKNVQYLLGYAFRNKAERLKNFEFALYRTYLVATDRIDQLYDLYHRKYPGEYVKLARENPALFCRIQALFKEKENQLDSAYFYAVEAEKLLQTEPNKLLQSRFYNRFGFFLVQHDRKKEALEKFSKSFELAKEASYFDYMLDASRQIESIYAGMGDYKNAYAYSLQNQMLADSITNMSKKDEVVMMEINHEARQRELYAEMQKQKILRRHNIQYTAIPVIIVAVFFLMMIIGSFKVPEWSLRIMGFFSFIFLFEFVVLVADHWIFEVTQGEPWKILLIKIGLIAILLPMHEWLEKKLIEYLLKHKLLNLARYSPINYIRKRTRKPKPAEEE